MNWLTTQVSLYSTQTDTRGTAETLRDILFCIEFDEIAAICDLRKLDQHK